MMESNDLHLIKRLEDSNDYHRKSFSYRYMIWKRYYSIRNTFYQELGRRPIKEPIKVLDVGCGDGWLIYRLKSEIPKIYNINFFGIDLSFFNIRFADQKNIIMVEG